MKNLIAIVVLALVLVGGSQNVEAKNKKVEKVEKKEVKKETPKKSFEIGEYPLTPTLKPCIYAKFPITPEIKPYTPNVDSIVREYEIREQDRVIQNLVPQRVIDSACRAEEERLFVLYKEYRRLRGLNTNFTKDEYGVGLSKYTEKNNNTIIELYKKNNRVAINHDVAHSIFSKEASNYCKDGEIHGGGEVVLSSSILHTQRYNGLTKEYLSILADKALEGWHYSSGHNKIINKENVEHVGINIKLVYNQNIPISKTMKVECVDSMIYPGYLLLVTMVVHYECDIKKRNKERNDRETINREYQRKSYEAFVKSRCNEEEEVKTRMGLMPYIPEFTKNKNKK